MKPDEITPLILTFDEEPNIGRTLNKLTWASEIVVVDSGSTDGTLEILAQHQNVRVIHRPFDTHSNQWSFGLDQVATRWALALDADYLLSDALVAELAQIGPPGASSPPVAYFASFQYAVFGRLLRGSLYPDRAVLFCKDTCHYTQDGHTQDLQINGPVGHLHESIYHDDRKPLSRWLDSQRQYAALEAEHLLEKSPSSLSLADRLRKQIWPAAPAVFLYTLLAKRCLLDGWPGWYYALQRTCAEILLSLELLDRRLRGKAEMKY